MAVHYVEKFFDPDNHITEKDFDEFSPDQRYLISVMTYRTRKYCWNYTRALVYRTDTQEIIADLRRNYDNFWYRWIFTPQGDFLLCSQNYQGYTLVNLATGNVDDFIPPEAKRNEGFIWDRVILSPGETRVLVIGHQFGMRSDIRVYDLSMLPKFPLRENPVLLSMSTPLLHSDRDIFKNTDFTWHNDLVFTSSIKKHRDDNNELISGVIIDLKID